jgi:cytochrome c-type biogenesis protein CcmH
MRSRRLFVVALLAALAAALGATQAGATSRVSFNVMEGDFMCVVCHEPLAVAQSPESFQERGVLRRLIAQGDTPAQIKQGMVAAYGPAVLALPPAHGFNLLVYILPPLILLLGIGTLAYTIPRWRRRAREAAPPEGSRAPPLSAADAKRLDDDLARST